MPRIGDAMDRLIDATARGARWLAVPLVLLLFLQWPLRDLVKGWSREANDLGQCLFAVYVAVSVTAATARHRHLAVDTIAHRFDAATRRWLGIALCLIAFLPWSLFLLISGRSALVASLSQLETFADTGNPGYFIVRASASLMAALMLVQAARDVFRGPPPAGDGAE